MGLSTKEKLIITNRRREVAKRYLKHMDQVDIAAELHVSQPTVSRDIEAINKKLEAAAKEDIKTRRARELAELDIMEKEAAENYYLSKQLTEGGRPSREMERWLKRWLEVKERKAKFLGLDQPAQIKIDDPGRETGTVVFYLPDNGRDPDFIPVAVPEKEIKE